MKNYYDELEISKSASKEVIERVYKVLAKKYHPDTTEETDKKAAEEKFKAISEAYEILSNDEKRKKYDLELEQLDNNNISYEEYINVIKQRDSLDNELNNLQNKFNQLKNSNNSYTQTNYQTNSNFKNNNTTSQPNLQQYNNSYSNSKKVRYYDLATGKPVSAITYYIYRIKKFFSNIGFILLAILAFVLMLNSVFDFNLFNI